MISTSDSDEAAVFEILQHIIAGFLRGAAYALGLIGIGAAVFVLSVAL